MNAERLSEIEALTTKASPGPWVNHRTNDAELQPIVWRTWEEMPPTFGTQVCRCQGEFRRLEDAAFIAASRAAVPDLCQALREAWARAEKAERLLHDLTPMGSEYHGNPEKCARYIRQHADDLHNLTVQAYSRAHKAEEALAELERIKGLTIRLGDAVDEVLLESDTWGGLSFWSTLEEASLTTEERASLGEDRR